MGFLSKAKEVISGKTELERKQEKAANTQIRKEVMSAQLRERKEQAVKYAVEAEKIKYQQKIKQLKQPRPAFSGFGSSPSNDMFGFRNYGSVTGQPRVVNTPVRMVRKRVRIKSKPMRRKKKYKYVQVRTPIPQQPQPRKFDILGI